MDDLVALEKKEDSVTRKATFEVSIRFKQNSTWQGQILWAEKSLKQNFRSVLEMLRLMDEALAEGSVKSVGWEDKG